MEVNLSLLKSHGKAVTPDLEDGQVILIKMYNFPPTNLPSQVRERERERDADTHKRERERGTDRDR